MGDDAGNGPGPGPVGGRSPESVTPRAVALVQKLLTIDYRVSEIWECLVRIACVPGHPLNAEFLHGYLAAFGLADQDKTWSMSRQPQSNGASTLSGQQSVTATVPSTTSQPWRA